MAEGVWRTIKGRHVYIKKGESLKEAFNRKKEEIQSYRNEAKKQISDVREGKEELKRIRTDAADWNYVTDEKGNVKKNADGSLKIKYGPRSKQYHDTEQKVWYTWAGPDLNEKYREDEVNALKMQDAYVYGRGYNTTSSNEFKDRLKKGQIKDSKINEIVYNASAAVGGNYKPEDERINRLKELETQMDTVYSKSPINVSESDFKRFNKPMMQDALNDLYLTQVQSENADLKLKEWKARANANTPQGRRYRDIVESAKSGSVKEQINKINNSDFYEANGYMAKFNYYPENDSIYTDVHNLNKRDDMSYPDVYDTYDRNSEDKKYGVNWSAMGTMSSADTKRYADRLTKAAEFADALSTMEASKKVNFKQMNTWQIEEMFIRQGYSEETARKMAKEYIAKRKRK